MAYGNDEKKDMTDLAKDIKEKMDEGEMIEDSIPSKSLEQNIDKRNQPTEALVGAVDWTPTFDERRKKSFFQRNRAYQKKGALCINAFKNKFIHIEYNLDQFRVPNPKDFVSGDINPEKVFNPIVSMDVCDEYPEDIEFNAILALKGDMKWIEGASGSQSGIIRCAGGDYVVNQSDIGDVVTIDHVALCCKKRIFEDFILYVELDANVQINSGNSGFGACAEGQKNTLFDLVRHIGSDDSIHRISGDSMYVNNVYDVQRASFHYESKVNFQLDSLHNEIDNNEFKELEEDEYVLED